MIDGQLLASVFVTLFVIMDPPGTVPLFLALTRLMTAAQQCALRTAAFTCSVCSGSSHSPAGWAQGSGCPAEWERARAWHVPRGGCWPMPATHR